MSKQKSKIGILGYGEVGQAIAKLYRAPRLRKKFDGLPKIKDLDRNDGLDGVDILHVCIPWSENFVRIVKKEIKKARPKITIIHSTVAPRTTKKIGGMVVHSPVRGDHPHLYKGIKIFVKYIGADNKKAAKLAKKHLELLGLKTRAFMPSVTTEIGKLLDTTYYGLCIAWHGEMKKFCDKYKIDFDKAVADFNKSYKEGYIKFGNPNVIRPILYPPQKTKGIGGHCVIPNAEILNKYFKSEAIDLVLKYKPKKKKS